MTYDLHYLSGIYTDLEIASGIPGLVEGTNRDESDEDSFFSKSKWKGREENRDNQAVQARRMECIKLIAAVENKSWMKKIVYKKLLTDELDIIVNRYAEKESLPPAYVQCVYQDKCIEILIKGFLKKFGRLQLLEELVDEISNLAKRIYINDDLDSAYDRVGRVQEFVHRKINKAHGDHAHLRLPVRGIRNLLSASRLHLNLVDIKKRDPLYLTYIIGKSEKQAYAECVNPRPFYPREGVQYKKNWRVRHIKPVSYYSSLLARKRMLAIRQIDNALPLEEFRERILLAYCELMPARC